MTTAKTLYEKIWERHAIARVGDDAWLLYIDRHLIHEITSPQAFEGLRKSKRVVRRPELTLAVPDHNVPTLGRALGVAGISDPASRLQVETLERNSKEFGVPHISLTHRQQGIVHIVGPELGLTLPGMTVVCGDSHTSTHGAFGALAFGIGTSEVEHVLATQTLIQSRAKTMRIRIDGKLGLGVSAKDVILAIIGEIGTAGATGHVIEYCGDVIRDLDMAGRMTVCNMSIEAGARAGMIAPDNKTVDWLRGRALVPHGDAFDRAAEEWMEMVSDDGAQFDRDITIDGTRIAPMVTWGTNPEAVITVAGQVPDPAAAKDPETRDRITHMLDYMGLAAGQKIEGLAVDQIFIGSCTNARLEDLRAAAEVARGRRVAEGVRALVVPGSGVVKASAEAEGLDRIFIDAGFEWRDAGCSMCLGLNPDRLGPGQRCAATSNRNFEGRQGPGGRTHLMSPAMAAAAAIAGKIVDVREFA